MTWLCATCGHPPTSHSRKGCSEKGCICDRYDDGGDDRDDR